MEEKIEINNNKDMLLSSLAEEDDLKDIDENAEIVFRNYIPEDRNFKIEKCYKINEVKNIEDKVKSNVLKSVKEFLNLEKSTNLDKPAKRNFDLKRNIAKKLNYLDTLTENSLNELSNKK